MSLELLLSDMNDRKDPRRLALEFPVLLPRSVKTQWWGDFGRLNEKVPFFVGAFHVIAFSTCQRES